MCLMGQLFRDDNIAFHLGVLVDWRNALSLREHDCNSLDVECGAGSI